MVQAVAELDSVRAVAAISPEWKVPPAFADRLETGGRTPFVVTVRSFEPIPERAETLGLKRVREGTYRGELNATEIRDLQGAMAVKWVEPYREPQPLLAESVRVVGAQQRTLSGINGSGVRVGVVDTGIEHAHPHFSGVTIVDSYDKKDGDYYPEADNFSNSGNDHGTHVAGTIAGSSTVGGKSLVGVAPNATLVVARGLGEDQFNRVQKNGTDIISNSWGCCQFTGRYTSGDQYTDNWARSHPQTLIVVSNGNYNGSNPSEQYTGSPALAKNVISVGAINDGSKKPDHSSLVKSETALQRRD